MKRTCSRLLIVASLAMPSTGLALADPVFPKSSGVGLEPPSGMTAANGFLGFQKGLASILIIEMPEEAFAQISPKRPQFEAQLNGGASQDFVTATGLEGFMVRGHQDAYGHSFRKWVVVLHAPKETAMITAQIPVDDRSISDAAIETALKTISLRTRPDLNQQIDALPYRVGDLQGFRITGTLMGEGLMLTEGPKDTDPDVTQPHVVISTNLKVPAMSGNRLAVARAILDGVKAVKVGKIEMTKEFDQGGGHWVNFEGTGMTGDHHIPGNISVYIRAADGDYIVIYGFAPRSSAGAYAARFRQIALSVTPKR